MVPEYFHILNLLIEIPKSKVFIAPQTFHTRKNDNNFDSLIQLCILIFAQVGLCHKFLDRRTNSESAAIWLPRAFLLWRLAHYAKINITF